MKNGYELPVLYTQPIVKSTAKPAHVLSNTLWQENIRQICYNISCISSKRSEKH